MCIKRCHYPLRHPNYLANHFFRLPNGTASKLTPQPSPPLLASNDISAITAALTGESM